MAWSVVPVCECPACQQHPEHPEWVWHQQMRLLLSRLDEQQRRWYVALEANRLGDGGVSMLAAITGLDEKTIRRGQEELALGLRERPQHRVRQPGAGRPKAEKKIPRS